MSTDKQFTVAGVTTHGATAATGVGVERTKVRYGTDMIRLVKMLNSPKKIYDRANGVCLAPVRVELVELPRAMTKIEALAHIRGASEFQSAEDQFVIQSELNDRTKAARRAEVKVVAAPSLSAIRARGVKAPV